MEKVFRGSGPKITVIGGGTGMSVILRALKRVTDNLAAVVTTADDGGGSGMLREDLGMLPPGDIRSCLLALADVEDGFEELMKFRFQEGRLAGQNLGNILIAGLALMAGSFEGGLERAHKIFRITGRVIPVTVEEITLCAQLDNGTIVRGESSIPKTVLAGEGKIDRVYLEPEGAATWNKAREAVSEADVIIVGPGSLYTSLIPNLLVRGITECITASKAAKIYICNVMTQKGETDGFTAEDHIREITKYMNGNSFDYFLVNDRILDEEDALRYRHDGSGQVLLGDKARRELEKSGIAVIEEDFIDVQLGYVRHNIEKVAEKIAELIRGL